MKLRLFAIVAVLAVATGWAQVRSNEGKFMDSCAGAKDDASCKTRAGAQGQCKWLTVRERDRLNIHTTGSCNAKGSHAGSCHTCTTTGELEYLGSLAKTEDPNAARKQDKAPKK
jgi:hypothetical protein